MENVAAHRVVANANLGEQNQRNGVPGSVMSLLRPDSIGPKPVGPGTNWMAIASFVLGLAVLGTWLVLLLQVVTGDRQLPGLAALLGDIYVVTPIGGLLAGVMGIRHSAVRGLRGLAIAGVVISSLALVVSLIVVMTRLVD